MVTTKRSHTRRVPYIPAWLSARFQSDPTMSAIVSRQVAGEMGETHSVVFFVIQWHAASVLLNGDEVNRGVLISEQVQGSASCIRFLIYWSPPWTKYLLDVLPLSLSRHEASPVARGKSHYLELCCVGRAWELHLPSVGAVPIADTSRSQSPVNLLLNGSRCCCYILHSHGY